MDRYSRDKSGNVVRDGNVKNQDSGNNTKGHIDLDRFVQDSYAQAVRNQTANNPTPSRNTKFSKDGYESNNRIEHFDAKNNTYRYLGKNHEYPQESIKPSILSRIKLFFKKYLK